jgi:hypothetical protein
MPVLVPSLSLRNNGQKPLSCVIQIGLEIPYPWITCLFCLQLSMGMTVSLWSSIFLQDGSLAPYKKSIKTEAIAKLFFEHVWVHFGIS